MISPPPKPFPPVNLKVIPADTVFHRVHNRQFGPLNFNPGLGSPTRFAPLRSGSVVIPTAYAAENFNCAIFETVLHDVVPNASASVTWNQIDPLDHSELKVLRPIRLAQLFTPDLMALGLKRADVIDTVPARYSETAAWAYALQEAHNHVSGLIWTSRASDPHWAAVLFGHRFATLDDYFEVVGQTSIRDCNRRLDELRLACLRIRVTVTF